MTRSRIAMFVLVFIAGGVIALGGVFLIGSAFAVGGSGGMMGSGYGGMMGYGGNPGGGYGSMMGGRHGGMMSGAFGSATVQASVTPAELASVRDRVEKQFAASGYNGFKVGEIMALTNNDYILVKDASGKPAFEMLADPKGKWLMPEPGPNMMWNTSYGMMRGINVPGCPRAGSVTTATGGPSSTAAEAKTTADSWLAKNRPGEVTADATSLPGYFTIDVTKNGAKVGMLSVNQKTGAVWFHSWHGTFLADQDF